MSELVRVGMAEYKLCRPPDRISTMALGSCGVVIYHDQTKWCGLAHIMMPDSKKISKNENRMKFADTCLADMYGELLSHIGSPGHFHAKVAGGAKMFSYQSQNEILNIGENNLKAVFEFLENHNIPIEAEDVGRDFGRTVIFDPEERTLHISAVGIGEYII